MVNSNGRQDFSNHLRPHNNPLLSLLFPVWRGYPFLVSFLPSWATAPPPHPSIQLALSAHDKCLLSFAPFLPLLMCLLKLSALLLTPSSSTVSPLSPVGRAMTHSLPPSLPVLVTYLPPYLSADPLKSLFQLQDQHMFSSRFSCLLERVKVGRCTKRRTWIAFEVRFHDLTHSLLLTFTLHLTKTYPFNATGKYNR